MSDIVALSFCAPLMLNDGCESMSSGTNSQLARKRDVVAKLMTPAIEALQMYEQRLSYRLYIDRLLNKIATCSTLVIVVRSEELWHLEICEQALQLGTSHSDRYVETGFWRRI